MFKKLVKPLKGSKKNWVFGAGVGLLVAILFFPWSLEKIKNNLVKNLTGTLTDSCSIGDLSFSLSSGILMENIRLLKTEKNVGDMDLHFQKVQIKPQWRSFFLGRLSTAAIHIDGWSAKLKLKGKLNPINNPELIGQKINMLLTPYAYPELPLGFNPIELKKAYLKDGHATVKWNGDGLVSIEKLSLQIQSNWKKNEHSPLDFRVRIEGKSARGGSLNIQNPQAEVRWEKEKVTLKAFEGDVLGGRFEASGPIWPDPKIQLKVTRLSLKQFSEMVNSKLGEITGNLGIWLTLEAGKKNTSGKQTGFPFSGKGKLRASHLKICKINLSNPLVQRFFLKEIPCIHFEKIESPIAIGGKEIHLRHILGQGDQVQMTGWGTIKQSGTMHHQLVCHLDKALIANMSPGLKRILKRVDKDRFQVGIEIVGQLNAPVVRASGEFKKNVAKNFFGGIRRGFKKVFRW